MSRHFRKTWQVGTAHEGVADSRHRVSAQAADLPEEVTWDIELLTSELLANAVSHGEGPVMVGVEREDDHVRVEVSDGSSGLPAIQPPEDPLSERGRGFLLVDRLADRWGFERRRGNGKTIWFELET